MAVIGDRTRTSSVEVRAGLALLSGELTSPPSPAGVVVVVDAAVPHAAEIGERQEVGAFVHAGFATLQLDLLAREERLAGSRARSLQRDLGVLAERMEAALAWLARQPDLEALPIGLYGAGTGSAAALVVAERVPVVQAIVARCGRPDLAYDVLRDLRCPTLWIVGGADVELLDLHHRALRRISANARLHVVPGVGRHLDEPGALDDALRLASGWFREHLARPMPRSGAWTGSTTDAKQGSSDLMRDSR